MTQKSVSKSSLEKINLFKSYKTIELNQKLHWAISRDDNPSAGAGGSSEELNEINQGPNSSNAYYDTDQQFDPNLLSSENAHQETVSEQIHARKQFLIHDKRKSFKSKGG